MNETLKLAVAGIAGGGLGAIFFGGLWWTVRHGVSSQRPALWFFVSLLLRTGIALAGFYFVSGRDWERLIACLVGFVVARLMVTWFTRLPEANQIRENRIRPAREASHAP